MSEIKTKTEAEVVAALSQQAQAPVNINSEAFPAALLYTPVRGGELQSLERYLAKPIRKRADVTVRDHASFIDYVKTHIEAGTVIFADLSETGGTFTAIIDYHQSGELGEPRFGNHVIKYVAEHTPEWKRWMKLSGEALNQVALALFIEDNREDIVNPDGATMLELVKTLETTKSGEFKSIIRLENGDRQLAYTETTQARVGVTGQADVPSEFFLRLPVFNNGPAYDVTARFRYRIKDGALTVGYEIVRPHKVVELALLEARNAIQSTLGRTILLGGGSVTRV